MGCLTSRVVVFVSPTKLPEETKGFARIAEQRVDISINDKIVKDADIGGRIPLLDRELAGFVRLKIRLQKILKDDELRKLIHDKGL